MLKLIRFQFGKYSRQLYVPKLFKKNEYNPSDKPIRKKRTPDPEVLAEHLEFHSEIREALLANKKPYFYGDVLKTLQANEGSKFSLDKLRLMEKTLGGEHRDLVLKNYIGLLKKQGFTMQKTEIRKILEQLQDAKLTSIESERVFLDLFIRYVSEAEYNPLAKNDQEKKSFALFFEDFLKGKIVLEKEKFNRLSERVKKAYS